MIDAVRNNAEWCHLVCRAHDIPGNFGIRAWTSPVRTPPYYPDAITLTPDATPDDFLGLIDSGPGASVKDSFAVLDLPGFEVLFEAQWIRRDPPADAEAPGWHVAQTPDGLPREIVSFLTGGENRSVLNLTGDVVGVSNVSGPDPWPGTLAMAARLFPGRPLVGYEIDPAPALRHGFTTTGPLRIWRRT